jgi:hypothetical protein
VWHASIALYGPDGVPVPTASVDRKRRRLGAELAMRLISGVGWGPTREEAKEVAFHARRSLSDAEITRIDQDWLAIEPVDMG